MRWLVLIVACCAMLGCSSFNTKNVEAFARLVEEVNARGSAVIDDPALEFYFYTETGVGARLRGVHAQGSGYAAPAPVDEVVD